MEGDPTLSIFSEARQEYTKQLSQYLKQPYLRFFLDLLEQSKQETKDQPRRFLWHFQTHLKEIRDWNADKADREINKIQVASGCDFLEELLTAIFIAHTKVLTSIRLSVKKKKINIVVPKLVHFLFRALTECADLLWSSAFLFRDDVSPIEKQQNMRQVEGLILEGFQQGIRSLLPVKSILRDLVPDEDEGDEGEGDEGEAEVSVQGSVETAPSPAAAVPAEPVVTEAAQKVLDALKEGPAVETPPNTDKEITTLPVVKKAIEVIKEGASSSASSATEAAGEAVEPQEAPVFTVDTRKRVSFSEHDNVFQDEEDETDSFFEPSSQGTSELADGMATFKILEETAGPLSLDDCEDITQEGISEGLDVDDFETM
jgi:hypothetical protein